MVEYYLLGILKMGSAVKLKWLEHMNTSWISEDCETISSRDGIAALYDRLTSGQEVIMMPQQVQLCSFSVLVK